MAKKKQKTVSAIQKAAAKACGISEQQPDIIREKLTAMKNRYKEIQKETSLENPWEIPKSSEYDEFIRDIQRAGNMSSYSSFLRNIIMGYWLHHKKIYRIPAETIDFLHNQFLIRNAPYIGANEAIWMVCKEPIYIEFDGKSELQGAFCGCSLLITDEMGETTVGAAPQDNSVLMSIMLTADQSQIGFYRGPSCSLKQVFEEASPNSDFSQILLEVIAYIAFASSQKDAAGSILVPETVQGREAYRLMPIESEEIIDALNQPQQWMKAGLCPFFGFLNRDNMIRHFSRKLELAGWENGQAVDTESINSNDLEMLTLEKAIQWETNRVVYQFNNRVEDSVIQQYCKDLLLQGIGPDLLQYFPHECLAVFQSDAYALSLVSTCKLKDSQDIGIFVVSLYDGHTVPAVFPCNKSPLAGIMKQCQDASYQTVLSALCAVYHILNVMKKKTEKMWQQQIQASPNKVRRAAHETVVDYEPLQSLRRGYSIPGYIQFFDITARTVKRVPDKEAAERGGWKMTPHVRRRHPHRYWIGKGENKHLEVRWLDDMGINLKEKKAPVSIVHEIK